MGPNERLETAELSTLVAPDYVRSYADHSHEHSNQSKNGHDFE
jgi:hypothetical protein